MRRWRPCANSRPETRTRTVGVGLSGFAGQGSSIQAGARSSRKSATFEQRSKHIAQNISPKEYSRQFHLNPGDDTDCSDWSVSHGGKTVESAHFKR